MRKHLRNFILNDKVILVFIIVNALIIFAQGSGLNWFWLVVADNFITAVFLTEMIVKQRVYGFRNYWKDGWNILDGTLVILSLPSLLSIFFTIDLNLSFVLSLRVFRVFKFFRIVKFFPNIDALTRGMKKAFRDSYSLFFGFTIIIFIFALLNNALFSKAAPAYFSTPLQSIYSVFRLFTVEGWYEIPDMVADYYGGNRFIFEIVRFYFCLLLIGGGIIGLSLVNSVFVDAMVSDNNDELDEKVEKLNGKIDELTSELKEMKKLLKEGNPEK